MNKIKLIEACRKLAAELEAVTYYADRDTMYSVDVKRHGSEGLDVSELAELPEYIKYKDRIIDTFTENYTYELYSHWLEYEGLYFIEDYLAGCAFDKGAPELNMLNLLDIKSAGLYGRSGGHFCILPIGGLIHEKLTELSCAIEDGKDSYGVMYTKDEALAEYESLKDQAEAVLWVLDEADKFNKGLKFEDELRFRIDECIDEWDEDDKAAAEIDQARELAVKHGYILAKQI